VYQKWGAFDLQQKTNFETDCGTMTS